MNIKRYAVDLRANSAEATYFVAQLLLIIAIVSNLLSKEVPVEAYLMVVCLFLSAIYMKLK